MAQSKEKKTVSALINAKKKEILETWMGAQLDSNSLRDDLMSNTELQQQSEEFLTSFSVAIQNENYTNVDADEFSSVLQMLEDISRSRALQGFTPRETGGYIFSLKDTLLKFLQDEYQNAPELLNEQITKINKLLDSLGIITFEAFIRSKEEMISRQRQDLLEVSTPVIKVWDGILALPIIGTLDSTRAQQVMEGLLTAIVETGYGMAIIDISGVPTVDTLTAQHLIKTVNAARLMGAECIISGIRPEIAQTIVGLGIDIAGVTKTKSSMAEAMKEALGNMGKAVVSV